MHLEIRGVHTEIGEGLREHIEKKVEKLTKFFGKIIGVQVVIKREKEGFFIGEINISADGFFLHGKGENVNKKASFEEALNKVVKQIKKHKEKITSHKIKNHFLERERVSKERVVSLIQRTQPLDKPMGVEEAALKLAKEGRDFLLFVNSKTGKINLAHRRENGEIEVVEPLE